MDDALFPFIIQEMIADENVCVIRNGSELRDILAECENPRQVLAATREREAAQGGVGMPLYCIETGSLVVGLRNELGKIAVNSETLNHKETLKERLGYFGFEVDSLLKD